MKRNEEDEMEFLDKKVVFWTFPRLIMEVYQEEEPVQRRLVRKFQEYDKTQDQETVARKVRNWLHDRNLPENREELFKICFALSLDESRAEYILGITEESGIHYRNPRELIYGFCLRKKKDYPEARELVQTLWGTLPEQKLEYRAQIQKTSQSECVSKMTISIRNQFKRVTTEKELETFLREYKTCFGLHHNTAYRKFVKMLKYLLFPAEEVEGFPPEQEYSVERVVREYLRMGMPYGKKTGRYSKIQKEIKKHWPTSKTINEMLHRKRDVDRKTLLLLYLATEGMLVVQLGDREKCTREHWKRIDLMMTECGMPTLDFHRPFDYLIIQAIRKEHAEDFMSHRMEWMLGRIFLGGHSTAYLAEKSGRGWERNG